MVSKTRWNADKNILVTCINTKRTTFFLFVFAVYDSLAEKACKQLPASDLCLVFQRRLA